MAEIIVGRRYFRYLSFPKIPSTLTHHVRLTVAVSDWLTAASLLPYKRPDPEVGRDFAQEVQSIDSRNHTQATDESEHIYCPIDSV